VSRENLKEKYSVLIVDDSEENSFFMERALRQSIRLRVIGSVRNAEETIAYLSGQGIYADRQLWPFPNVMLLDLKTPGHNSANVPEWLRGHPQPDLKIVVPSGSRIQIEIEKVKALGADAFSANTPQHAKLIELVASLEKFFLSA
jgi:CheY-like chemotaxis protein